MLSGAQSPGQLNQLLFSPSISLKTLRTTHNIWNQSNGRHTELDSVMTFWLGITIRLVCYSGFSRPMDSSNFRMSSTRHALTLAESRTGAGYFLDLIPL